MKRRIAKCFHDHGAIFPRWSRMEADNNRASIQAEINDSCPIVWVELFHKFLFYSH